MTSFVWLRKTPEIQLPTYHNLIQVMYFSSTGVHCSKCPSKKFKGKTMQTRDIFRYAHIIALASHKCPDYI